MRKFILTVWQYDYKKISTDLGHQLQYLNQLITKPNRVKLSTKLHQSQAAKNLIFLAKTPKKQKKPNLLLTLKKDRPWRF